MFHTKLRPKALLTLIALFALAAAAAAAQRDSDSTLPGISFEISGQVRSASGDRAVANVMVRLERFGGELVDQSATDGTGRFRFPRLWAGQYVVSARAEGLAAASPQLDITRLIPRRHVILQLRAEDSTFRRRDGGAAPAAVVDAGVPEEARREFELGRAALEGGRAAEATAHLERAAAIHPDFFEAQLMLGTALVESGEWEKAEGALGRAVELRPKASGALVLLGEVYRRQKKYAEAERSLVQSLKLDRASWQGHFTLGRVYYETDEVLKAAPHVGRVIQMKPESPEARLLAGNVFMRLNMRANALTQFERYLTLAPRGEFAAQARENVRNLRKGLPRMR